MPDPLQPAPPVVVTPSTVSAAAGTIGRDIAVIAAALPALLAILGRRDAGEFAQWINSSEGLMVIAILAPLVASGWRAVRAWREKEKLVTIAHAAPDTVAVVTTAPPAN